MKPWHSFSFNPANEWLNNGCHMENVMHVTHTSPAIRILEDNKIVRGLIHDKSILNKHRTTVNWLSPNTWYDGSRYGNVEFSFSFKDLVYGKKIYWVEEISDYSPIACRFMITDKSVDGLPIIEYDPTNDDGPLRLVDNVWWRNKDIALEFMLENDLYLKDCKKLDFITHHRTYCAINPHSCKEKGSNGNKSSGRLVSAVLGRGLTSLDHLMINSDASDVSMVVQDGLESIIGALGYWDEKFSGPLHDSKHAETAVLASLSQLAFGDDTNARETALLIDGKKMFIRSLNKLCHFHFGVKSSLLKYYAES